jgi:hypothetical protein
MHDNSRPALLVKLDEDRIELREPAVDARLNGHPPPNETDIYDHDFEPAEPAADTPGEKERRELCEQLDARRYDHNNPPPKPEPIFKLNGQSIATPGNIVVIQSKAKGGKSGFIGAKIARAISDDTIGDYLGIEARPNADGKAVVHFDTEQSRYDAHQIIATSLRRGSLAAPPAHLRSYFLADIDRKTRRKMLKVELERAREAHGSIFCALIDGVGDLVVNVNDPEESNEFVSELHQLAIKYDTVIIVVLHENPGENTQGKTRGHLGSELERKAETNLRLEKDSNGVTTVWTERSRHALIVKENGATFQWDDDERMHLSCVSARESKKERKRADKTQQLRDLAEEVFKGGVGLTWSELHERIAKLCGLKNANAARRQFSDMKEGGIIEKNDALDKWFLTPARRQK